MASAKKTSSNTKALSPSSKKSKLRSPMKKTASSSSQKSNSPNKKQSNSPKKSKKTNKNQQTGKSSRHPAYLKMVTEALTSVNDFHISFKFNQNNFLFRLIPVMVQVDQKF
jgi:hypothetical protein